MIKTEVEEEPVVEETTEETYNGMPVAQVETTVEDFNAFLNYVDSFENPGLFVYNEKEGYVIKMEEGEYYQLKADDRIFETGSEKGLAWSDTLKAGGGENVRGHIFEMIPDYLKYDSPHKVIYTVTFTGGWEEDDEYYLLTCYFDAPTQK